jgi:DASS family divalent anion:Na+ symporter
MKQLPVWLRRLIAFGVALLIWFLPIPWGLSPEAWHLFAIFFAAILAVLLDACSILVASITALVAALFTGTLTPEQAYSGFSASFMLLILMAFLVAKGVVHSGLGTRIAFLLIRAFGHSSLRLSYCIFLTDAIIAPAFPSNTARSGVLYPITLGLAVDTGSRVEDGSIAKTGRYLMMSGIASLTVSSALWLTAMGANPVGVSIAAEMGIAIDFLTWLIAASVPCLIALITLPWVLYKLYPPEVTRTPEAPRKAAEALRQMGPMSRQEWIMGITFVLMITLWVLAGSLGIDNAAVAFFGLAVVLLSGIFTTEDLRREGGDALETYIWFAILYTLSSFLNEFGFMSTLGERLAYYWQDLGWPLVYLATVSLYVLIHYLFVSQTAHLLALFAVFLGIMVEAGVPPYLSAFSLLFASNYFAAISPQGSSANVLFAGSGYLQQREIYRQGGMITLINYLIFITIGSLWVWWVF